MRPARGHQEDGQAQADGDSRKGVAEAGRVAESGGPCHSSPPTPFGEIQRERLTDRETGRFDRIFGDSMRSRTRGDASLDDGNTRDHTGLNDIRIGETLVCETG